MRRAWRSEWIGEVDAARLRLLEGGSTLAHLPGRGGLRPRWEVSTLGGQSAQTVRTPQHRYRESSQIQFTSQVLPPSGENDCSMRAELGEMLSHM
jgi:hypothetical protein